MAKLARDVMTRKPARCLPETTLDVVARLMVQHNCGEIPVVDSSDQIVGVVTDRDIVSRVVAKGKNPCMYTAGSCMSFPVVTLHRDAPLEEVVSTMEGHQNQAGAGRGRRGMLRRDYLAGRRGLCGAPTENGRTALRAVTRQSAVSLTTRSTIRRRARTNEP